MCREQNKSAQNGLMVKLAMGMGRLDANRQTPNGDERREKGGLAGESVSMSTLHAAGSEGVTDTVDRQHTWGVLGGSMQPVGAG